MKTENATQAKTHFGRLLDMAVKEPVTIRKSGRNVAVILSYEDYERLIELEDKYWLLKAIEAQKEGYIGTEESEKLLDDLLNAED